MAHEFVVLVNGVVETYERFEDIPAAIDNVIRFRPEIPAPPHTDADHEEIRSWLPRLAELMLRERGNARRD